MGLDTDKLIFFDKYEEAAHILIQSKTGSAKMYPTTRENLLELAKRGKIENLKTYFTPESIEQAMYSVDESKEVAKLDTSKEESKTGASKNKSGKNSKNNGDKNSGESQK